MNIKVGDRYRTWSIFHYGNIISIDNEFVTIKYDAGYEETVPAYTLKR